MQKLAKRVKGSRREIANRCAAESENAALKNWVLLGFLGNPRLATGQTGISWRHEGEPAQMVSAFLAPQFSSLQAHRTCRPEPVNQY
jgi:hypothetical protein